MARHDWKKTATAKRQRSFHGGIERLETRALLAGDEWSTASEPTPNPPTSLHDPLQIAAPAHVRQMTIGRPAPSQLLQPPLDHRNESHESDPPGRPTETDSLNRDQALVEWDQDSPSMTETEDSEPADNGSPAVSPDDLDDTGGTVTDQTSYNSPERALMPVLPIQRAERAKIDTPSAAMVTLVSPPQSTKPLQSSSLTASDLNAHVSYIDDDFHYFEQRVARGSASVASLSSEPLANHAAVDSFMAMSMLGPSGTEDKDHGSAKTATNLRHSASNATLRLQTSPVTHEQVAIIRPHNTTPQPTATSVRFGSLPMVTLLHSVMLAGQMVLNSTAEQIQGNSSHDEPSSRGQFVDDHDAATQTAMTCTVPAGTASATTNPDPCSPDPCNPVSWQNSTLFTVVCASLSLPHSLAKRTKPLQWTWHRLGRKSQD
ncbi:hypothetical protein [Novipirellula caenicola]|uniref:Uncharacterized protein n=1 Tax=Novipirellula caenicola TaxID=1536901 RepID=A0ABP9VN83_9BACT